MTRTWCAGSRSRRRIPSCCRGIRRTRSFAPTFRPNWPAERPAPPLGRRRLDWRVVEVYKDAQRGRGVGVPRRALLTHQEEGLIAMRTLTLWKPLATLSGLALGM